ASTAPERPEQVAVLVVVDDEQVTSGSDNLHLQDVAGGCPESFGEASESTPQREPSTGTDGRASAPLHVSAVGCRGLVDLQPPGTSADRDRCYPRRRSRCARDRE